MSQLELFPDPAGASSPEEEVQRLRALVDHYGNLLYQLNTRYSELTIAHARIRYAAHVATGRIPAGEGQPLDSLNNWLKEYGEHDTPGYFER